MALIKCSECGKEISDKSKQCIHCGCPIEESNKKFCEECGKEISNDDKVCKNCGCPIDYEEPKQVLNTNKKDKDIIKYENLTKQQMQSVIQYRKNTNQWIIGTRVWQIVATIIAILGVPTIVLYIVLLVVCRYILLPKVKEEDKQWFKDNYDKLIKAGIINEKDLNNTNQKKWEELNTYDLEKIKSYRLLNNEWKTSSRTQFKIWLGVAIFSCIMTICLILIFIPLMIFAYIRIITLVNKTIKEEDKQWYEKNKDKLYSEKYLPL